MIVWPNGFRPRPGRAPRSKLAGTEDRLRRPSSPPRSSGPSNEHAPGPASGARPSSRHAVREPARRPRPLNHRTRKTGVRPQAAVAGHLRPDMRRFGEEEVRRADGYRARFRLGACTGEAGSGFSIRRRAAVTASVPFRGRPRVDLWCSQLRVRRTWAAALSIASSGRSTSWLVVAQLETEMRIATVRCQVVPPSQHVPSRWTASILRSARTRLLIRELAWVHRVVAMRNRRTGSAPRSACTGVGADRAVPGRASTSIRARPQSADRRCATIHWHDRPCPLKELLACDAAPGTNRTRDQVRRGRTAA